MPKEALLPELRKKLEELREKGYYPFVAIFTWTHQEDLVALERFQSAQRWFQKYQKEDKPGIDPETAQTYYLTGARTFLVIGYTNSPRELQGFCSTVIFNTPIQASFHHALEVHELEDVSFSG